METKFKYTFCNNPGTTLDISDKSGHTKIISRYLTWIKMNIHFYKKQLPT